MSHLPTSKTTVSNLIGTFQREVKKEILFDVLRLLQGDLNTAYSTLFEGPLPAVDGYELTRLNGDSIEGILARTKLPEEIAYEDEENTFQTEQNIWGALHLLVDDSSLSDIIIGSISDSRGYIAQNLQWDGANFVELVNAEGSVIDLNDGDIAFLYYDNTDLFPTWRFNGFRLFIGNQTADAEYEAITMDANDLILLGEGALTDGKGHIGIPVRATGDLPAAAATQDGTIAIDSTTQSIVFYTGGNRYAAAGIAF